jgi:hypothetical protein
MSFKCLLLLDTKLGIKKAPSTRVGEENLPCLFAYREHHVWLDVLTSLRSSVCGGFAWHLSSVPRGTVPDASVGILRLGCHACELEARLFGKPLRPFSVRTCQPWHSA